MAFPIIPLITAAVSLGSAANKKRQAKLAEKGLEGMQNPTYRPNQSILDYYSMALKKYQTSPTDTAGYKRDTQNIRQSTTQALSSLNKLRSGDVANIVQGQNNSLLKAAVNAENRKAQELGVLADATRLKAGEGAKEFQYNQIAPFEKNYNLLALKAAGSRADQRTSTQNAYNNLGAAASILAGGDGMGGEGNGNNSFNAIFGNKGQRSLYRWNKGGQQWWQN